MKYNEIVGLMQEMTKAGLTGLIIEKEDFKLVLNKEVAGITYDKNISNVDIKEAEPSNTKKPQATVTEEKKDDVKSDSILQLKKILSPMVGTFYAKPSPDKPPYVQVGDMVKKGQTVCIIEAMKLMNEIESEVEGEIVECLVENEEMVEFGQPLFIVK